jgi:cell wall assembly regulator SMI1
MRNLKQLKFHENERQPPTDEQIRRIEAHFEIRLPRDLVKLLRFSNGGSPELNDFLPQGGQEHSRNLMNAFCFLNDNKRNHYGMWAMTRVWRQATGCNVLAIGESPGGDGILLSFDTNPPCVKVCIHDNDFEMVHVADSFGEFIDLLEQWEEPVVLKSADAPVIVGSRDLRELRIAFQRADPPTKAGIRNFEKKFGVVLPKDYLTFLQFSNGGEPELNAFVPNDSDYELTIEVDAFYYLNDADERECASSLWNETLERRHFLGKAAIPIGHTTMSYPIYLSYESDPPCVKIMRGWGAPNEVRRVIHVADSFSELIGMLGHLPKKPKKRR